MEAAVDLEVKLNMFLDFLFHPFNTREIINQWKSIWLKKIE